MDLTELKTKSNKPESVIHCARLYKYQHEFLKKNKLKFSIVARAAIDELMAKKR